MRYMHWSYPDYLECPVNLVDHLIEKANAQAEQDRQEAEMAKMRRHK